MTLQRFSLAAVTLLLAAASIPAFADDAPQMSCSRMQGLDRAQCLVKQHMQFMGQLTSNASSSVTSSAASSSAMSPMMSSSSVSSSSSAMEMSGGIISCSRISGLAKAQCLAKQHKQIIDLLSHQQKSSQSSVAPKTAGHPICTRYTERTQRLACLTGKPIPSIGSSSSSTSSKTSSSSSSSTSSSSSSSSSVSSSSAH